jgi:signal transduction histidine kinase
MHDPDDAAGGEPRAMPQPRSAPEDRPLTLVVADDSPEIRAILQAWFDADHRFVICGESDTLTDTVELAAAVQPTAVILDWSLPSEGDDVTDPQAAIRQLRSRAVGCRIVVLSGSTDPATETLAKEAGASAYLRKGAPLSELTRAVLRARDEHSPAAARALPDRCEVPAEVARLDTVAHELRGPLTALQSYTYNLPTLMDHGDVENVTRVVQGVQRNVQRLDLMLASLVTQARVHAGSLRLDRRTVDLSDTVVAVCTELRPLLASHAVTIDVGPEVVVHGDASRLRELISYLLLNAVRSGPSTHRIALRIVVDATDVTLTCSDTGPAIPVRELLDGSADGEQQAPPKGHGLGLPVAASLASAHGGALAGTSEPGDTTLALRLPRSPRPGHGVVS